MNENYNIKTDVTLKIPKEVIRDLILKEAEDLRKELKRLENEMHDIRNALKRGG